MGGLPHGSREGRSGVTTGAHGGAVAGDDGCRHMEGEQRAARSCSPAFAGQAAHCLLAGDDRAARTSGSCTSAATSGS